MHCSEIMRTVIVCPEARLAQPVERKALNLVVVGSSPTVGVYALLFGVRGARHGFCKHTQGGSNSRP